MKRVVCLLVIVSIAYAGCADKKPSKVTAVPLIRPWVDDWESYSVLPLEVKRLKMELTKAKIMLKQEEALLVRIGDLEFELASQRAVSRENFAKLESELSEYKSVHEQNETLLVKIDELETTIESQGAVESIDKALLVRIAKLEAVTESQSAVIKSSKNVHRLHEVALEYQRVALDSLLNLCRLYEAKIESQRAEMELFL